MNLNNHHMNIGIALRGVRVKLIKNFRVNWSLLLFNMSSAATINRVKVERLKNAYKGKRIFIVCNGPSLMAADLDKIARSGDYSFASNKIDKIFSQTAWRPTFYCVSDETFQFSLLETMQKIPAKVKFFRTVSYMTTRRAGGNCVYINMNGDRALLNHPRFAEDCSKVLYGIATVTYVMLQIAVHMGFREIYIIGCDNSYGKEVKKDGTIVDNGTASYFAGSDEKDRATVAATWEMNVAYDFARRYADEHGIKIFNATRGGYLEAFERMDFDLLFDSKNQDIK